MSMFETVQLACPACGEQVDFEACGSVNAGRSPELRAAILDGSFQSSACAACETVFRLAPQFNYLDIGRSQWLTVHPVARIGDWAALEAEALSLFGDAYGASAPGTAREIGRDIAPRVAFGWWGLAEKLVAAEAGLDDALLELVKIALLRSQDSMPFATGNELRLAALEDDALVMFWVEPRSEAMVEALRVPRGIYDQIAAQPEGWETLHAAITSGIFVDLQRLTMDAAARHDDHVDLLVQ